MLWHAVMFGVEDTPWEGGTFKLTPQFTGGVPEQSADGEVCDEDVPSEHIRGRVDLLGYFAEPVVANLRRCRGC